MSTSFSANQYHNAFYSKKLQNWQIPRIYQVNPRTLSGCTTFIATDRGHLMNGIPRSRKNPWGDFVGTWDLPKRIPGHSAHVPTARSTYAQEVMQSNKKDATWVLRGGLKNSTRRNLDPAYASRNPPVVEGATNPPEQTSGALLASGSPFEQRSGAAAPATSMFPAIGTTNVCESGQVKPPTPCSRIPTPGLADPPIASGLRTPSPPAKPSTRLGSGMIAL